MMKQSLHVFHPGVHQFQAPGFVGAPAVGFKARHILLLTEAEL